MISNNKVVRLIKVIVFPCGSADFEINIFTGECIARFTPRPLFPCLHLRKHPVQEIAEEVKETTAYHVKQLILQLSVVEGGPDSNQAFKAF